jgi:hypothetical protein
MRTITVDDVIELATKFKESEAALSQYWVRNYGTLPDDDLASLVAAENDLHDNIQELMTNAVGKILDDAQASLNDIKRATAAANDAIKTVTEVKKIITIATSLVTLVAAIYTGNLVGISTAITDVFDATNPAPAV